MSSNLAVLYKDLQKAFDSRLSDLKKAGVLLSQLKVIVIQPI